MKLRLITIILLAIGISTTAVAQKSAKDLEKERKEQAQINRNRLNQKVSKDAKKEAKKLAKEGWKAAPGTLILEKQLDRSYMMQMETDAEGYPKYFFGDATSVAANFDAASVQANDIAKMNLAGKIATEVAALIESTVSNQQMSAQDAESVTKTVAASKSLIAQSIGRTISVMNIYKESKNGNVTVRVMIAYNYDMAIKAGKNAIRKQLEEEGNKLHGQLDQVLGL